MEEQSSPTSSPWNVAGNWPLKNFGQSSMLSPTSYSSIQTTQLQQVLFSLSLSLLNFQVDHDPMVVIHWTQIVLSSFIIGWGLVGLSSSLPFHLDPRWMNVWSWTPHTINTEIVVNKPITCYSTAIMWDPVHPTVIKALKWLLCVCVCERERERER